MDEWKMRLKRFRGNRGNISHQLEEFVRIFGQTEPDNENIKLAVKFLEVRKSFVARSRFLKESGIYRQRPEDDRIFTFLSGTQADCLFRSSSDIANGQYLPPR